MRHTNWAGNYRYRAAALAEPTTAAQLRDLLAGTGAVAGRLRVAATGHTFNDLPDTTGTLLTLRSLPRVCEVDTAARTVRIDGGASYGEIAPAVQAAGLALPNLASLPHISVAGAIATGTHGSGVGNKVLADAVVGFEVLTADGELRHVGRDDDPDFPALATHLGAFGVITALTLRLEPTFDVATTVYLGLPWDRLTTEFAQIAAGGYSVSVLPQWSQDGAAPESMAFVKRRFPAVAGEETPRGVTDSAAAASSPDFFGGRPADRMMHLTPGVDPSACTPQLGDVGPWHLRLAHFRLEATPSSGDELQTEYLMPIGNAPAALEQLRQLGGRLPALATTTEVRTVAADDFWLSPAYQTDSVAVHFTWKPDQPGVQALLPELEARLGPLGARPHWGKLFATPADRLSRLYPRFGDAADAMRRWDPNGRFSNDFLRRVGLRTG